jgi:putative endonuclease
MSEAYWVYIMSSETRTIYIGTTNDLRRRIWEHRENILPGFTRRYRCHALVFHETYPDPHSAIAREKQLKGWNRDKKNALIFGMNPQWKDLSDELFPELTAPHRLRPDPSTALGMTNRVSEPTP